MNAPNKLKYTWYGAIATLFGLGFVSKMPGTLGSAVFLLFFLFAGKVYVLLILIAVIVGIIASYRYAKELSSEDPEEIIIDEAVGFWVSVFGLGTNFAVIGFFLYRVVDIIKPFPARYIRKLPRGAGIMADDIWCGVVTNVLLRLAEWLFFADGLRAVYGFFGAEG